MNYRDYLSALDAASAWTSGERNAIAAARSARDDAHKAWQAAGAMKPGEKREAQVRATRQAYDRANAECGEVVARFASVREGRQRAAKVAWQAESDRRTRERLDRQTAAGPGRGRILVG